MLDRTVAPPFSNQFHWTLPAVEKKNLPHDISVTYLAEINQPICKIECVFHAGKWMESRSGLSHFALHLLDKGTAQLSAQQLAELFERQGAQIEVHSGQDFAHVSLYALTEKIEHVLPVFCDMMTSPVYPEQELKLFKDIYTQQWKINQEKTNVVAARKLKAQIFGAQHPYGNATELEDVAAIQQKDLIAFQQQFMRPKYVFVTGKITDKQKVFLENIFSQGTATQATIPTHTLNKSQETIQEWFHDDKVQCTINLGRRGLKRTDAHYAALRLLSHITGGYFGSRLMANIREEKGLTYGIYSYLQSFYHDALFMIGADVNKENWQVALKEIHHECERLQQDLIDDEELSVARNHLLGTMSMEVANPFYVMDKIKTIQLYQLNERYYQDLTANIQAVTPIELQQTAQQFLQTKNWHGVIAG